MRQHPARDVGPRAATRQAELRRLTGACFLLGAFGIAFTVYRGDLLTDRPQAMVAPVLFAVTSGALSLTFPWDRYDPRWFVLMCLPADVVILWTARLTGGVDSPITGFFYVVAAIAGAYRGGWLLIAQVGLTALMSVALAAVAVAARMAAGPPPSDAHCQ